jgi:nitrogen fixation protein FixH
MPNLEAIASSAPSLGSRYGWPVVVVAMLAGHMLLLITAMLVASARIPGAVVAPAGYGEALAWDERQAARRASDRLGWTLDVSPADFVEPTGERRVQLIVRDAAGIPVEGAAVELVMYHYARPDQRIERRLAPGAMPGIFDASLPLRREGQWRLYATATRGDDRLVVETDLWVRGATR